MADSYTIFEAVWFYASAAPTYHVVLEVTLVLWIIKLIFFSKQYNPEKNAKPSAEEEEDLIREWEPEPLVPDVYPKDRSVDDSLIVSGIAGSRITVEGQECLNLATFNFLGFLEKKSIHDIAANTIRKYGVGSCGPRGFYGTVDVHLDLEEKLAQFTKREEAIIYSYGFETISSAIPAYSKRSDVIFCDEGVCFTVQKGLVASRSKVRYFKHNDMDDLQRLLEEQKKLDKKNPAKAKKTRKFIIAEGIYMNYGDIAPLPRMLELRKAYQVPIILEESFSFGVLGPTGRGIVDHFGVDPAEVDMICASMNTSLGSMGGFSAGKSFIIDHQRLSGLGYCFSASLPPLLATSAIEALAVMDTSPQLFEELRGNARRMRELLDGVQGLNVGGDSESPLIHLRLQQPTGSRERDKELLQSIANECLANQVAVVTAKYLEQEERYLPQPSIRLTVSSKHSELDLTRAASVIKEAANKSLS